MFQHVTEAKYLDGYKVWLTFNDGISGEVDLREELYGEIFEPLQDKSFFRSFVIDGNTLTWANGADFAPEFLRENLKKTIDFS